jgi:3-deoxy-D-manno-octulosonic-acid transferase
MLMWLPLILYQIVFILFFPFYLFALWWKGNLGNWSHRCGYLPSIYNMSCYWFHGASVGEILSLRPLFKRIMKQEHVTHYFISTNTRTGFEAARKAFPGKYVIYLPFDIFSCIITAFKHMHVKKLIIVEAERWPMLVTYAKMRGAEVVAFNARLRPDRVAKWWNRIWYHYCYSLFDIVYTQNLEPFDELGLEDTSVSLIGSAKALSTREAVPKQLPAKPNRIVLLVGSVWEDELPYYLALWQHLKNSNTEVHLALVARHFNWEEKLVTAVKATGATYTHWSAARGDTADKAISELKTLIHESDISITCVMGTLFAWYPYASIFYLGGTFNEVGGHNVLEPAAFGLPVITGPCIASDNNEALELERVSGLQRAGNAEALCSLTSELLDDSVRRERWGEKNKAWLSNKATLIERQLDGVARLMKE